jgi:hypothetical protein
MNKQIKTLEERVTQLEFYVEVLLKVLNSVGVGDPTDFSEALSNGLQLGPAGAQPDTAEERAEIEAFLKKPIDRARVIVRAREIDS